MGGEATSPVRQQRQAANTITMACYPLMSCSGKIGHRDRLHREPQAVARLRYYAANFKFNLTA